jgi:hypothetical protein
MNFDTNERQKTGGLVDKSCPPPAQTNEHKGGGNFHQETHHSVVGEF